MHSSSDETRRTGRAKWASTKARASRSHWRCGVGESEDPGGPFSTADLADDLAGLLDALEVPRAHVLGVFLGGMVAQELALRHPMRVARLLLNYRAADLSLEGSFLAGLIAGPYAGAIVGFLVGMPPVFSGEFTALPFAVGCGFAGGGLRELCPKEAIWHFSPFVFTSLHRRAWAMVRSLKTDWQVMLLITAPMLLPSILAAFFLSVTFSWDEFIVAFLLSRFDVTLPVEIWSMLRSGLDPRTNAIGSVVFLVSVAFLVVLELAVFRKTGKSS